MPDENRDHPISDPEWEAFLKELNGVKPANQPGANSADNFPTAEHPLNPKEAREEAVRLWRTQQELLDFARNYPYKPNFNNFNLISLKPGIRIGDRSFLGITMNTQAPKNPIKASIRLFDGGTLEEWEVKAGIRDATRLEIGKSTDPETLKREDILDPSIKGNLGTNYYFNSEGEFWKISAIPPQLLGEQKRVGSFYANNSLVRIVSEMTSGDFELAGLALQTLKDQILPKAEPPTKEK